MDRYARNGIISKEEQMRLRNAKVCVVGCGGLGGYSIEMLARFGIGKLTVVDGDVFNESNLNRQLLSLTQTLGKSKAFTAGERILAINDEIQVNVVATYVDSDNIMDILHGHDIIVDALDSNAVRSMVLEACEKLDVPCVHGAIAGWYGQVSTVFPKDTLLREYLLHARAQGIEMDIGNPSFIPACIASYQVSETIKVLLNRGEILRDQILFIDLFNNETELIKNRSEL